VRGAFRGDPLASRVTVSNEMGGPVANYLARVELYDSTDEAAEEQAYERLHTAMEERGFLNIIQSDEGTAFQLPTATYVIQNTDMTLAAAHDTAVAAAEQSGMTYSAVVVEFENSQFTGLEPLPNEPAN
jgi:hypothetical protein